MINASSPANSRDRADRVEVGRCTDFRRADAPIETIPGHPDARAIQSRVRIDRSLLQGYEVLGIESMGQQIGAELVLMEFGELAARLRDAAPTLEVQGPLRDGLANVVEQMKAAQTPPTVIIAPADWRLEPTLGLREH